MNLKNCYNFGDFRELAKKKLPSPIFHYIDGGADDEITLKRNTNSFNDCDLIPVSYTHLRAHETDSYLVCRLLLEKR